MSINLVDIIIAAILLFSLFSGMYKGFLASGLSALGFVAAWLGAMNLFPYLSTALLSNKTLVGTLTYYLDADALFKSKDIANTFVNSILQGGDQLNSIISDIKLPSLITDAFKANVLNASFENFGLGTLSEYLNQTIITSLVNLVSFIAMFLIAYLVVVLFINLLDSMFRFPSLRFFDGVLGGIFGLARGAVVVMLLLAAMPVLESVVGLDIIGKMIAESQIAQYFPTQFAIPDIIRTSLSVIKV